MSKTSHLRSKGLAVPLRGWMFALPADNNINGDKYSTSRHAIGTAIEGKFRVMLKPVSGTPDPAAVGVFARVDGQEVRLGFIPGSTRQDFQEQTSRIRDDTRAHKQLYGHLEYFKEHPTHNDFCLVIIDDVAPSIELPDEDNIIINALNRQFRNVAGGLDNSSTIPDNTGEHANAFSTALKELRS